jgi:hypothetical protein
VMRDGGAVRGGVDIGVDVGFVVRREEQHF